MPRFFLIVFLVCFRLVEAASPSLVIIDAGHGGKDSGGTGNGLIEKNLNLDTALRLHAKLTAAGVKNILTRDADFFIELDERVAMANKYLGKDAVLVSIHYNAVGTRLAHGVETFFWRPDATALASRIQHNIAKRTGLTDIAINRRRIRLTRNPEIPSVLVEGGYMTNPTEAQKIGSPAIRDAIAQGICDGILELQAKGETGIPRVPEVASPLSKATDPADGGERMQH